MAADRAAPRQLDCWAALEDWHARWVLAVGVLPALLLGAVALRWLHQRRGGAVKTHGGGGSGRWRWSPVSARERRLEFWIRRTDGGAHALPLC